jgi:hypothetical protein
MLDRGIESATERVWVLLFNSSTMASRVIKAWTGDTYTHAVLSLDRNMEKMYSFGISEHGAGFLVEKLEDYGLDSPYSIYEALITKSELARVHSILDQFANSRETSYNLIGTVHAALTGKDYKSSSDALYCSQFVRHVLEQAGAARLFGKKLQSDTYGLAMKPYDFARAPGFRFVRRGVVSQLIKSRDSAIRSGGASR